MKRTIYLAMVITLASFTIPPTFANQVTPPIRNESSDADIADIVDPALSEEGQQALAHLNQARRLNKQGNDLIKAGKVDDAIAIFQKSLTVYPPQGDPYRGLIQAYTIKSQDDMALKSYRTLIYPAPNKNWGAVGPSDTRLYMEFAILLSKKGQRDEALAMYKKAIEGLPLKLYPSPGSFDNTIFNQEQFEAAAHTAIAIQEICRGQDDIAMAEVDTAIKIQPHFAPAYFYRGRLLEAKKRYDEANSAYEKTVSYGRGIFREQAEKKLAQIKQFKSE